MDKVTAKTITFTLYNTTGVIEKNHNLYYLPRVNYVTYNNTWLEAFNNVAIKWDNYTEVEISQWSPEDRTLVIQGSITNFRHIKRPNYIIVKETDTYEDEGTTVTETRRTAFVITDMRQIGINSIELTLDKDIFTTTFCLNVMSYTTPITFALKNCYVERQHYDRVDTSYNETNLDIFANIEEQFKYKRQYRDMKRMLNYGDYFTDEDLESIENSSTLAGLGTALAIKVIKHCCAFLHVVLNSSACLTGYLHSTSAPYYVWDKPHTLFPNLYPYTENQLTKLIVPVAVIPNFLSKYETQIKNIYNNFYIYHIDSLSTERQITNAQPNLSDFLSNDLLQPYILTAYLTRESYFEKYITFTLSGINIEIKPVQTVHSSEDYEYNYLIVYPITKDTTNFNKILNNTAGYQLDLNTSSTASIVIRDLSLNILSIDIGTAFLERNENDVFDLDLSDEPHNDIKTTYYDPVLSFNPYSFYTISYLGQIEVPLNKINYYEDAVIECDLSVIVSDVCKYTFIPSYTIGGLKQKMYQESLVTTFANQLTVVASKLEEYLIANQTQMKNQYAVNNMDLGKGLISSVVGGTGQGIRAGAMFADPVTGLIAGGVAGGVEAIGSAITYVFNQAEITMNQKAKLADLGNLPDNIKQVGTDINSDILVNELGLFLNHYTIDRVSYNSICKYLERYGYKVNIFDTLNVFNRKGWNYIKLVDFEFEGIRLKDEDEENIRQILTSGVTLLHEPSYLHNEQAHNYEIILD